MRFRIHNNNIGTDEANTKLISKKKNRPVIFNIIQYDELSYDEYNFKSLSELNTHLSTASRSNEDHCTWVNVEGTHDKDILTALSKPFNLHTLTIEDIFAENERMKLDILDNNSSIFLLMKILYILPGTEYMQGEQISFILKENNMLITFLKSKDETNSFDIFQVVKHRLKNNRGRIRSLKTDYLFYCLIDVLMENYIRVLDAISVKIDRFDKILLNKLKQNNLNIKSNPLNFDMVKLIYSLRHDMLRFRILCQPLREIIIKLQKTQDRISIANQTAHFRRQYRRKKRPKHIMLSGNYFHNPNTDIPTRRWSVGDTNEKAPLFNEYIFMYFKDLNDRIIQLQDRLDTYCDLISGLITFFMILTDDEMNRIMTCLALVSIIFIPLTFIIGLFSMNFQTTPPLEWYYGHFVVLAVLGTVIICMISFFKWKKWL